MYNFVKSPLNYMGGKYKLLSQIIPLFKPDIRTFVDLFGGGFNVGVNIDCETVIYNDVSKYLFDLLSYFYRVYPNDLNDSVIDCLDSYDLMRRDNPEGYMRLRTFYNEHPSPLGLYALITCSFGNQMRFNKKGHFNVPYGKRFYNTQLQDHLIRFVDRMQHQHILFFNHSFRDFDFSMIDSSDFVYLDPPYFNSVAGYNEHGGWTECDERDLLDLLDGLTSRNIFWALSNNLKLYNPILDVWKDKYHVYYLNGGYQNCNYHKKDRSKDMEVLICNY